MANALTFELSKVGRMDIRKRMVGHLRHIDEGLAQEVADGLGLPELPPRCRLHASRSWTCPKARRSRSSRTAPTASRAASWASTSLKAAMQNWSRR